ncbi:hypothetical protein DIU31_027635 [Mucilaginibacter rubeus]|uniref:YubB ferredoxin-like domain-containing protein n=1 Tax=Mucilaginibacter rubeus TaxID=2027860 RepID=A0AAE6JKN5_9SPHI|nr:hypothetical protein [Mucilaginibacter rubeus]QEM07093.1 hypothetical protein DIU31_027635 [Mucilaginibacter rubeus]QTE43765.1 hypothetical protein J3L19_33435 [Mucilaginibacter rubeus]QTE50364.1 hypothetical protein J3L21_33390 [Mucilaginibacter rubeus]QTE55451.1 hypothetical protein J3L23_25005 [Mucilaginibacter rubeus]QTE65087.1 hypothetical protein J3L22_08815 [Mucilaginibacter rubeus]
MANMCRNMAVFTGEQSQLQKIAMLFTHMAIKEKQEDKGQLPSFITPDKDWFFNIEWDGDTLFYDTRWSPNFNVMQQVADHYQVGFILDYTETGNLIYGQASYEQGKLNDIFLKPSDFDKYEYDEEADAYIFENNTYENSEDILEILLDRKKGERL